MERYLKISSSILSGTAFTTWLPQHASLHEVSLCSLFMSGGIVSEYASLVCDMGKRKNAPVMTGAPDVKITPCDDVEIAQQRA